MDEVDLPEKEEFALLFVTDSKEGHEALLCEHKEQFRAPYRLPCLPKLLRGNAERGGDRHANHVAIGMIKVVWVTNVICDKEVLHRGPEGLKRVEPSKPMWLHLVGGDFRMDGAQVHNF